MKAYLKGTIIKSVLESFQDDNTKEFVEYHKNWVDVEGDVVAMNSKESFAEHTGKTGVIKINLRGNDKMYKVSLAGFIESDLADGLDDIEF